MSSSFPKLKGKAFLSPMAGVTDVAFRTLCKKYGAALTYTEFISSTALVRGNYKTGWMLQTDKQEKPVAIQLFGSSVKEVVEAAKLVEHKFDIIDVNCGCPAWKVIKTGAGSELLKNPKGIGTFINKLASAISKPVTLKIRIGVDENTINAVEVAKIAEDNGASAIAVHGRTQKQGYKKEANWEVIKEVKEAVNIPVIGNGDVTTPEIFKKRLEESGVDYIMIARAAMGDPYLFTQFNDYLKKGNYEHRSRIPFFFEYAELAKKYNIPFNIIKTQAMTFTKSVEGGALMRNLIGKCKDFQTLEEVLQKKEIPSVK